LLESIESAARPEYLAAMVELLSEAYRACRYRLGVKLEELVVPSVVHQMDERTGD
jgi:hypothetical protein